MRWHEDDDFLKVAEERWPDDLETALLDGKKLTYYSQPKHSYWERRREKRRRRYEGYCAGKGL